MALNTDSCSVADIVDGLDMGLAKNDIQNRKQYTTFRSFRMYENYLADRRRTQGTSFKFQPINLLLVKITDILYPTKI